MQRHQRESRGNPGGQAVRKHTYRFHNVHAATPVQAFRADALFDLCVYPTLKLLRKISRGFQMCRPAYRSIVDPTEPSML